MTALPLVHAPRASDTLIEPCAGSAALSLHLLGASAGLMPYQGSKWRLRHELSDVLRSLGALGRPRQLVLQDAGPWGWVWPLLMSREARRDVVAMLESYAAIDPREVYNGLHGTEYKRDARGAASFLFLQRMAFSGKAVSGSDGRFTSPGFNTLTAYGVPETDRFGEVLPQAPTLVRRVRELPWVKLVDDAGQPAVVYIDPPYVGTTGYPDGDMTRSELVALATGHAAKGRTVLVSEADPVGELVALGWSAVQLTSGVDGRFGKQDEWVTMTTGG